MIDWRQFGDWVLYFVGTSDPSHAYTTNKDEAYRSPSRSEEARLEDEQREAADTSRSDDDSEVDPLEDLLPEVQQMTPGLDEESQRWTAQVILAAGLPNFVDRKAIYAQFGSAKIIDPQFDRARWEQWKSTQTS